MADQARDDRHRRAWLIAAGLALIASLGAVFVRNFTDFAVYYAAGRSLLSGRTDLYAPEFARGVVMDYRYLPIFILVFAPLSLAPYTIAAWVWHVLNTAAIAVIVASLASVYAGYSYDRIKVWGTAFLIVVPYYAMALDYGNVQLIVTALTFAGLTLALARRELPAAALLAAATTVKIVPALVLPYFVLRRRFQLIGLIAIMTIGLNLLPSFYFGLAGNRELVGRWYEHVIGGQEFHETNGPINLSLKGQLRRTFTVVDYTKRVDGDHRYAAVNITAFPTAAIDRVWLSLSACLLAAGLVLIWRTLGAPDVVSGFGRTRAMAGQEEGDRRLDALQVGLMIGLLLVVGPLTSKIYLVALLWPVVAVGVAGWKDGAIRRPLVLLAAVSGVLPLLPGRTTQRFLLVLGTDFYVTCAVLGLVVFTLTRWNTVRQSA